MVSTIVSPEDLLDQNTTNNVDDEDLYLSLYADLAQPELRV
jgi:hypothetical protein